MYIADKLNYLAGKIEGNGLVYVMTPNGMGCMLDEAMHLYRYVRLPKDSNTLIDKDKAYIKLRATNGRLKPAFTVWRTG